MFQMLTPLPQLEIDARKRVYSEFVERHKELEHVTIGCHNDMIMLATDGETQAAVAVLLAQGQPGDRATFPRHLHTKGEVTICLDGCYGEYLEPGENPDDLFAGDQTLAEFQALYPVDTEYFQCLNHLRQLASVLWRQFGIQIAACHLPHGMAHAVDGFDDATNDVVRQQDGEQKSEPGGHADA